ncbi:MAG: glutaminyl-tRNA synthase (glutamine-hydrolyzing) subunit B [Chloroflexi bacterium RBG_13_56_8b]|nr:MAG: glutaminyl-tRNA synthase (glutamine-hydrolyzing) subunit B [Chloroflexi bacterium RBG_13_56_8b]
MEYETVIGLEVHAQLLTKSKMFCRCSTDYTSAPPNSHVCPVCLGMPGVLPTINQQAVEFTVMTAIALHCTISDYTKFDRKNYPYPDLMKGYQISQSYAPIGHHGWLVIDVDGQEKKVGIDNVHLEEDVAKLLHRTSPEGETYSLVDVNRSGVPLMEIVGEPDLRSPEEARQYLMTLRSILRYLGVSTANMEEGSFRCDANISIRPEKSKDFLAKVEVKNMNSFKAVYLALEYEAKRQRKMAAEGKKLLQETRGWVEDRGITVAQRSKEYAHDYRYFPEPDLAPLVLDRAWVEEVESKLPELPEDRRSRFVAEYGLPLYDAKLLTASREMADYFEDCLKISQDVSPKEIGNWLLGEVSRIMNAHNVDIVEFRQRVSPEGLVWLILATRGNVTVTPDTLHLKLTTFEPTITIATAKSIAEEMYQTKKGADGIIDQRGLSPISDTQELEKIVIEVINSNAQAVADYKAGKKQSLKFLVGQLMRATRGRANPAVVNRLMEKKLEEG